MTFWDCYTPGIEMDQSYSKGKGTPIYGTVVFRLCIREYLTGAVIDSSQ